jgi:arsenite methyltransferase
VLLKPLREAIQKSAEAYTSCVAGAEIKDKYLGLMRDAGFKDVKVLSEKNYPFEFIISEPEVNKVLSTSDISDEQLNETANSIVSIGVSASK